MNRHIFEHRMFPNQKKQNPKMYNSVLEKQYIIIPIKIMKEKDASSMAYIHSQSFKNYWKSKTFLKLIKNPSIAMWVAKINIPIGLIVSLSTVGESEIITLAVLPQYRKNGIARNLLKSSMVCMSQNGIRKCHLEVATNNCNAVQLYTSEGFKIVGVRKNYYNTGQNPCDAHLMTKNLCNQNQITSI